MGVTSHGDKNHESTDWLRCSGSRLGFNGGVAQVWSQGFPLASGSALCDIPGARPQVDVCSYLAKNGTLTFSQYEKSNIVYNSAARRRHAAR